MLIVMVRAAAEGAEKEEENEESLVLFLSVWLMTGCACVSYTDKRRKKRKGGEELENSY